MPSTRRQKAKARKSREMDMMSDFENLDVMLGNSNNNPIERELAEAIDQSSAHGDADTHTYLENEYRDYQHENDVLRQNEIRHSFETFSNEFNLRLSQEMDSMMSMMHNQINRAVTTAINERVIPEIQNIANSMSSMGHRDTEASSSPNSQENRESAPGPKIKIAKKDSRSVGDLRDTMSHGSYNIHYKTLDITPSQTPFQVIFNPVKGINSGTFYRTIHPQNITLSIQDVFHTYMQKLIEYNEHQDTPLYRPSHLQELKHLSEYFEVPDLDTKVQRHDNPHYWLQRDILQIKHFQFKFFTKIILTDDTIPQVKIFTHFLLKFLRFNYQLLWEQKDQQAYLNFPQALTHIELLPYIINNQNKHLHYIDLTSLNVTHFEQINLDHNFVLEHSETSDNRPYTTSDTSHTTTHKEQTSNTQPSYIRQQSEQSEQSEQESPTQETLVNLFQNPDSPPRQPQLQVSDIQLPNPSETNTIHNTSEFSEETVQNTRSSTITDDSNLIIIPTHTITQNEITNQNQDNTSNTNPDNTSVLSTSNTTITHPSHTQILSPRNYNPPSVPPQFSTQINTHNSPQQSSSNTHSITQNNNTVHFQTPTPPSSSEIQTLTYTPAQTNSVQNTQPTLNINTIHSNPSSNYTTARQLSRPPLQPILTNPLSYNLTSTNPSHTQQSQINYNTHNQLNTLSSQHTSNTITPTLQTSQFHIPNPPSTTIRTNPHLHSTSTTSLPNISNNPTYNTTPPSTMSHNTMSHPTYITSSTSISEPIKPFDGLDHNYTPEEYLQHIEARVTFSLGLQPTLEHEYKFWHARRMAFIQCSLTGTALSWYIRLNDTYKHDWHAFVQAFKKQFSSQKNAYYAQVEALNLTKKDNETVRHFALKVQQLVEKGWCNENASTINLKCNEIFTKGLPKNLKILQIKDK